MVVRTKMLQSDTLEDLEAHVNLFVSTIPFTRLLDIQYQFGQIEKYGSATTFTAMIVYKE